MVRRAPLWLELVESVVIVAVLFGVAWFSWHAIVAAYQPVVRILNQF
jgi:hypothetical protein